MPFLHKHRTALVCLVLVLVTLAVYWQVRDFSFVNYDDQIFVKDNNHVQRGVTWENILWAFSGATEYSGYWAPLTWLSFLIDYEISGIAAGGYHLTNVLFHVANAMLLFLFLKQSTGDHWRSGFVAALFALHPLQVESVAWVTERKDVLSTFFGMLVLMGYTAYAKNPARKKYIMVFLLFFCGLMAKPMLVTLPFVFLLLDYWPLSRFNFAARADSGCSGKRTPALSLIVEKIPFILILLPISVVTFIGQKQIGALETLDSYPIRVRLANALVSYVRYIGKMLWPVDLAVIYPHPGMPPGWQITGAVVLTGAISFLCIWLAKRKPWLAVGWFWYIGTLVPVIGVVQIGSVIMADRYTYIPLIGLFIIIVWGVAELMAHRPYKTIWLAASATIILSILMAVTSKQVQHWKNSITLFEHTIGATANNFIAHINLGLALADKGRTDDAIGHYRQALRLKPDYVEALNNLANALADQGRTDEAIGNFRQALRLRPDYARAHYNLGYTLARRGQADDAIGHYREALRLKPDYVEAHYNLALKLADKGQTDEAIGHFRQALRLKPDSEEAHNNLANALARRGQADDAIGHYRQALRLKPDYVEALNNLAITFIKKGNVDMAVKHFKIALQINPNYSVARNNLKKALMLTQGEAASPA
ncbi:MAG: tetratricopeptide repeat protein, partial [Desulfobacterales bacterium]|nr:tetratricopeptide repeat protein [Desulfobacterales bacterium]